LSPRSAIDAARLGELVSRVSPEQQWGIEEALMKRNLILAAIGAFVIIGAIGSVLSGNKTSSAPAAATSPKAAATTAPPATAAPSAATPPAETAGQQITDWVDNGGQTRLDAIGAALGSIGTDGEAGSFPAVAQDCSQLSAAIAGIQAAGPIPGPKAQRPLARALSLYGEAAAQCTAGAKTQDTPAIEQATAEMTQGEVYLGRTTRVIKSLNGS